MTDPHDIDIGPGRRRIAGDIEVDGVLRIADDTVCEGDLTAPAGVVLGARCHVLGDIYTDGPIELGPGARVDGDLLPASPTEPLDPLAEVSPTSSPEATSSTSGPRAADGLDTPEAARARVESTALASTVDVLLTIALEATADDTDALGIDDAALDDLLEGTYHLITDLYRDGDTSRPWSRDELDTVLVQRVLPSLLPVTLEGRDDRALQLRVARPTPEGIDGPTPPDWVEPTLRIIEHLARTVRPAARIERLPPANEAPGPHGPDTVVALLRAGAAAPRRGHA